MLAVAERKNQLPYWMGLNGLTVYGLSKKAQMPYHQVNRLVNAPVIPDGVEYKTLRKLADVLGISLDQLESKED